ncbi:MAG: SDR family NAD(P)-dependent oxidoreductase [Bacteroidota bacterium]
MNKDTAILITGATGFIGSYVVRQLLAAGYTKLCGLRRSTSSLELLGESAERIAWRTADVTDYFALEDAFENMEVIIHCAALVSFQPADKERLLTINRGGTRNVVNAALHHKVERLVYISSVAALGRNTPGQLTTEKSKWEDGPKVSQYSRSKFLSELEVWRGQAEGLSVAILYPSIVLGGGRWTEGSVKLFDYAAGAPSFYPSGNTGVVDVRDVAQATLIVLERGTDRSTFLLNGSNVSYKMLLQQMVSAFGHPPPARNLSYFAARWLARLERIRSLLTRSSPLLTRETVQSTYQDLVYDSSQSELVLGLHYHDLEQTIQETVALYKATKKEGFGVLPISEM